VAPQSSQPMYKPRVETPGGRYHVGTRGNNKQPIFLDDDDRARFLLLLGHAARRHGWIVHSFCLMTNHYHLVLQLSAGGMSRGMCQLNGGYSAGFNARHGRSNHLFGRRFWDVAIEDERQYLETCRYVVLNPVRAGMEDDPASWLWSSYRATAGLEHAPSYLGVGEVLGHFGATPTAARDAYVRYVSEGRVQRQPPDGPPAR